MGAAMAQTAPAPAAPTPACDKPVYLSFRTGSMEVAPLVAVVLKRHKVRATFFASADPTPQGGDALDSTWAPWWKARGDEGHAFASQTRDEVLWLGDVRGKPPGFLVRPQLGAFAGRTFTWSAAKYCENINVTADRLAHITGVNAMAAFRAPGDRVSPALVAAAKACGFRHVPTVPVAFLAEGANAPRSPTDKQVAQTVARVRPGDVLLAHLGVWSREVPQVPVGLEPLITGLQAQGFCFRTLREHPVYGSAGS